MNKTKNHLYFIIILYYEINAINVKRELQSISQERTYYIYKIYKRIQKSVLKYIQ